MTSSNSSSSIGPCPGPGPDLAVEAGTSKKRLASTLESSHPPDDERESKRIDLGDGGGSGGSAAKRQAIVSAGCCESNASAALLDVCDSVGLKAGDRIEVMWDVHYDGENGDDGDGENGDDGDGDGDSEGEGEGDDGKEEGRKDHDDDGDAAETTDENKRETTLSKEKSLVPASSPPPTTVSRWWGATLLMHDGRSYDLIDEDDEGDGGVGGSNDDGDHDGGAPSHSSRAAVSAVPAALRVLDYDPYPEGGFRDHSLEEVVFLSDRSILNVGTSTRAHWRKEGDHWEPSAPGEKDDDEGGSTNVASSASVAVVRSSSSLHLEVGENGANDDDDHDDIDGDDAISLPNPAENLRTILDNVLCAALAKTSGEAKMKSMTAARRAVVAEKIARTKEALLEKMMALRDGDEGGGGMVITADHIRKCMEEIGREL